ncbi:MAG: hypothetical protein IJ188_06380 [Clostridia bacterium]|nr:hypothetical protein [Clostridia bacterium]
METTEKNELTPLTGFEEGTISAKKPDTKPKRFLYKVKSATRDGIESRWMEAPVNNINEHRDHDTEEEIKTEYEVGENVYYFMFPDGRGMIIGKIRMDI